jgi:deoxycytidylate deaminase
MPNQNLMERIAKKSDHSLYMHCSLLYAGARLIASGYNHGSLHSEIVAIRALENQLHRENSRRPRNLHMVNLMIKRRSGELGNSYPCHNCRIALKEANVKQVTIFVENSRVRVLELGVDY